MAGTRAGGDCESWAQSAPLTDASQQWVIEAGPARSDQGLCPVCPDQGAIRVERRSGTVVALFMALRPPSACDHSSKCMVETRTRWQPAGGYRQGEHHLADL
jgi:hypothetical protein